MKMNEMGLLDCNREVLMNFFRFKTNQTLVIDLHKHKRCHQIQRGGTKSSYKSFNTYPLHRFYYPF